MKKNFNFSFRYDENGMMVNERPNFISANTKYPFKATMETREPMRTTFSVSNMAGNLGEIQKQIKKSVNRQKGSEFNLGLGKMVFTTN